MPTPLATFVKQRRKRGSRYNGAKNYAKQIRRLVAARRPSPRPRVVAA